MNIDPRSPQLPPLAIPARSVHTPSDQASSRPVERPHHGEAPDNQGRKDNTASETGKEPRQQPSDNNRSVRRETDLTPEQQRELEKLRARDREVRAHEAAHKNAAGHLARGGAHFSYETGPDGRRYAVGGEVSIDSSKVSGDPQATIAKAQVIRRAAQAPVEPSAQDHRVAAEASRMEAAARNELAEQRAAENTGNSHGSGSAPSSAHNRLAEPAPVGTLLDVIV
jgi:hypothetical protein